MKKLIFVFVMLLTLSLNAQTDGVIQFMGIPVDGTKTEMISKLKQKGFTYDNANDVFNGEFDGQEIIGKISIYKNKVYSIRLTYDVYGFNKSLVISKYNSLVQKYDLNKKYYSNISFELDLKSYMIDSNEDISYEMTNGKSYTAKYYYKYGKDFSDTTGLFQYKTELYNTIHHIAYSRGEIYEKELLDDLDDETIKAFFFVDKLEQDVVGFYIVDGVNIGTYNIVIDYINKRNSPNGDDL